MTKWHPLNPRERAARLVDIERAYHLVFFDLASRGLLDEGYEHDLSVAVDEVREEIVEAQAAAKKRRPHRGDE